MQKRERQRSPLWKPGLVAAQPTTSFNHRFHNLTITQRTKGRMREWLFQKCFMVVDMRKELGMMVQLITPRAKRLHDAILRVAADWDGKTDLLRKLG